MSRVKAGGPEDFLINSARLLAASSPSTSAYLSSKRTSLLYDSGKPLTQIQRREICPVCGSLQLPGWNGTLTRPPIEKGRSSIGKPSSTSERKPRPAPRKRPLQFECHLCHHKTLEILSVAVERPTRAKRSASSIHELPTCVPQPSLERTSGTDVTRPKPEHSSSKKRGKARKRGLQALLAKGKQQSQSVNGSQFNLLDFMKP